MPETTARIMLGSKPLLSSSRTLPPDLAGALAQAAASSSEKPIISWPSTCCSEHLEGKEVFSRNESVGDVAGSGRSQRATPASSAPPSMPVSIEAAPAVVVMPSRTEASPARARPNREVSGSQRPVSLRGRWLAVLSHDENAPGPVDAPAPRRGRSAGPVQALVPEAATPCTIWRAACRLMGRSVGGQKRRFAASPRPRAWRPPGPQAVPAAARGEQAL